MDDVAERIEEIKRLWFNTTPVKTPHYKYAETRRESAIWLITELEKARVELVDLKRSKDGDFEVFHELRMRLTEACGNPYKLHMEALESIISKRDNLQSQLTSALKALELAKDRFKLWDASSWVMDMDKALANLKEFKG